MSIKQFPTIDGNSLLGAYLVIKTLKNCIPILHAGKGCVNLSIDRGMRLLGIRQFTYRRNSTSLDDRSVITGGEQILKRCIGNTQAKFDGRDLCVISNFVPHTIGDNVEQIVRECEEETGKRILLVRYGEIGEDFLSGFNKATEQLISSAATGNEKEIQKDLMKSVNIFGIYPYYDQFWRGNREELRTLFRDLNMDVKFFPGPEFSANNIKDIFRSHMNIGFGKQYFENIFHEMQEKYGIPYLIFDHYPIGIEAVKQFLHKIALQMEIGEKTLSDMLQKRESDYYEVFYDVISYINELNGKKCAIIATKEYIEGLKLFFINELGISTVIECPINKGHECLPASIDTGDFYSLQKHPGWAQCDIILGRRYDKIIADENKLEFINMSSILSRGYRIYPRPFIGHNGAVYIVEKLLNRFGVKAE